jgi:bifunctional DNA-binding transcriptional regulator/antitoxin component of YhaV-PrlF toxin-antitoxin module
MIVTVKNKTPLIVPDKIRRRAGFKPGEEVEFRASGGVITITPRVETAEDEYTPEQRKVIDREIRKGMRDIEAGRFYGPFSSVNEMAAAIESEIQLRDRR